MKLITHGINQLISFTRIVKSILTKSEILKIYNTIHFPFNIIAIFSNII